MNRLSGVAEILMGQSPESMYVNENEIGMPFLQGNAEFRQKHPANIYWVENPTRIANKGDILLSVRAPVGEMNLADKDYCIGRGLSAIRFNKTMDSIFGWYALLHYKRQLNANTQGTTFQAVNRKDIEEIEFSYPRNIVEQRKIAEILSTLDSAVDHTDAIIKKYQRIKQALMQDLLTKGIDEKGHIRSEKTHRFKNSPLGRIPAEWSVYRASAIMRIYGGSTPSTSQPEYWDGAIPWLTVDDFNNGSRFVFSSKKSITSKGFNNSNCIILKKRMLIISARGTVGVIAQLSADMAFNQTSYGLDSDQKFVSNDFLYYLLNFNVRAFLGRTFGGVFDTITRQTFDTISLPIPSIPEQDQIHSILSQCDETIEKERETLAKYRLLKCGLMQDLLTGKMRVNSLIKGN